MDYDWIHKYLTAKYSRHGRSMSGGIDCWGLVIEVYREMLGIELPIHLLDENVEVGTHRHGVTDCSAIADTDGTWLEHETPKHYDLVMMSKSKIYMHVGVYLDIDGGSILHAYDGVGCTLQRVSNLLGGDWKSFKYYRYENP